MSLTPDELAQMVADDDGMGCAITHTPEPARAPSPMPDWLIPGKSMLYGYDPDETGRPFGYTIPLGFPETGVRPQARIVRPAGHYHDPLGTFDYCTDPHCQRNAGS
jgi:hypothetical protein